VLQKLNSKVKRDLQIHERLLSITLIMSLFCLSLDHKQYSICEQKKSQVLRKGFEGAVFRSPLGAFKHIKNGLATCQCTWYG